MNIPSTSVSLDMTDDFYTTEELAGYLKLSDQTIRLWIRQGKIKSLKFGRSYRIPLEEVQRILREAKEQSEQEVLQ